MQKANERIYALARELNVESGDLVDLCRCLKIDAKDQLSSLDPEQRIVVEDAVRYGPITKNERIYVLARELNVEPGDLIDLCRHLGIDVKNQLSWLSLKQRMVVENAARNSSITKVVPVPLSRPATPSNPSSAPSPTQKMQPTTVPRPVGTPALSVVLRPQPHYSPSENPGIEHLLSVGEKAGFDKLQLIPKVALIDPESAMFKIRKLTEKLCRILLKPSPLENLNDAIMEIGRKKLLGKKAISYLNQIRTLSNVAVHVSDDLFDDEFSIGDVNNAADGLACVIDEVLSRNLAEAKRGTVIG